MLYNCSNLVDYADMVFQQIKKVWAEIIPKQWAAEWTGDLSGFLLFEEKMDKFKSFGFSLQ